MPAVDERPPVWVGHAVLTVSDVAKSADFWAAVGLRQVHRIYDIATSSSAAAPRLLLHPGDPAAGDAPFDLMVDDIAAAHTRWSEQGFPVSAIENGRNHEAFWLSDPDGNRVLVNSSHVMGAV